jgi:hypothetical protein
MDSPQFKFFAVTITDSIKFAKLMPAYLCQAPYCDCVKDSNLHPDRNLNSAGESPCCHGRPAGPGRADRIGLAGASA